MAVQTYAKPKCLDEIDDDEVHIIFKRRNVVSKQNQLNPGTNKPSSQNARQQGKRVAEVHTSIGKNVISQEGMHTTMASPMKSPARSSVASTSSPNKSVLKPHQKDPPLSSTKESHVKSLMANSRALTSPGDQSKHLSQQSTSLAIKEEKPLINTAGGPHSGSEDSEDNKPLSARLSAGLLKQNSNHTNREPNASSQDLVPLKKPKLSDEFADADVVLSSKFMMMKSNAVASTSKCLESETPLVPKFQQNVPTLKANQHEKSSVVLNKRPLSEVRSSSQSSVKKLKVADGTSANVVKQVSIKIKPEVDDDGDGDDHVPISQRINRSSSVSKPSSVEKKVTKVVSSSLKKTSNKFKKGAKNSKYSMSSKVPPKSGDGQKWTTLVHNGVIFPAPYKPHGVKMNYKGKPVDLTPEQEEVATMFAVMLDTDYMTKPKFKENFLNDWRKILGKNHVIQDLEYCDFRPIYEWHQKEKEKKKQMTTEEKKALKEEKLKQEENYMWAIVDGVKEKVGNFRVEPPGLFRGRGEHPKMGKLKKRIQPSDITINIGKGAPIPECPIPGESWKEIRHDNTVTWLAFWNDPINPKEFKYVFLAASSSLKGQSDKEKYEKARMLKDYIQDIRAAYTKDYMSKDMTRRQIAVATYLIDKLALRAGNEKDDDEADTVGCCTLKVENVEPIPPNILKFDFLGKDSIRYQNEVKVECPVFKAIRHFQTGKSGGDDLFDKLDTSKLNAHLKELMPGLTAKVFRTYNASITLDDMLNRETSAGDVAEKVVVFQHANKQVAIICNHQRTVSKSHSAQMLRLKEKIEELKGVLDGLKVDLACVKKGKPPPKTADGKQKNLNPETLEKKIAQTTAKIEKMERDKETKEDLKTVALGTSKINYLDPRITVAWCKRQEVPIEKIFNKSLLAKFAWAMDVDPSFRF
ncbi:DNA topoisomerase [Bertholletia excelsa]